MSLQKEHSILMTVAVQEFRQKPSSKAKNGLSNPYSDRKLMFGYYEMRRPWNTVCMSKSLVEASVTVPCSNRR